MKILNYKYRLVPNKSQEAFLSHHFFIANQIWNYCLEEIKNFSKNEEKLQQKLERRVKFHLQERNLIYNSGMLQQEVRKFLHSYFLKCKKKDGFLRFKSSNKIQQSFEFKNQGIQVYDSHFKIMRQKIKMKQHRQVPNTIKKIVVKRESDGNYYVIFSVEVEKEDLPKTGIDCGIDMNVSNIAIATTENKIGRIPICKIDKYSKKYLKVQRKLSARYEKKNNSNNTKKLQKRLNKIHKKVQNVKNNYFHFLSKFLVNNFDRITIEDLEITNMLGKGKRLNREILSSSWGSLIKMLEYKTELMNKELLKINPAYSSQRCNSCGYISRRNRRTQSKFLCKECGNRDNADNNAAKNILFYKEWEDVQKQLLEEKAADKSQESLKV